MQSSDEKVRSEAGRLRYIENKSMNPILRINGGEQEIINIGMKLPLLPSRFQPTTSCFSAPHPLQVRKATLNLDKAIDYEIKHGRKLDTQMDRKKLRRTVSNRLSAQRSRQRRAQHILDMERKANELEVTLLLMEEKSTRLQEKRRLLKEQNDALEQLLLIRQHQANHSQMVLEKNKAELMRLKEVQKALLKPSSSRCSGFYEDDDDEQGKQGMDEDGPFLNFSA